MNIMLTCAGRRNYLVRYFRNEVGDTGNVLAVDASDSAPALQCADKAFILPRLDDPTYLDALLSLCDQENVQLLLSLNDFELPLLAANRSRFLAVGTMLAISPSAIVDTCLDKWATHSFLLGHGLSVPKTFLSLGDAQKALRSGEMSFPVVVKPRWGTASIGVEYANDAEELDLAYRLSARRTVCSPSRVNAVDPTHSVLIQEQLVGDEYGLDIVNDLDGNYVCTFAKRKLAMRAGETDRAVTVHDPMLTALGEAIGRTLGHVGNLDCDVFVRDGHAFVLEMNPRFGGGYPFSHVAGANLPAALIAWANGMPADPQWLSVRPGVVACKYYEMLVVSPISLKKDAR